MHDVVFLCLLRWSVVAVVAVCVGCLLVVYRSRVSLQASVCSVVLLCLVEGPTEHAEVSLCLLLWFVGGVVAVDVGCLLAVQCRLYVVWLVGLAVAVCRPLDCSLAVGVLVALL